ncbi:hypothetical protein OAS19_06470 [Altererythrobacter sp.]|nr:hypothetical protein [Altererythrobacter sp.]
MAEMVAAAEPPRAPQGTVKKAKPKLLGMSGGKGRIRAAGRASAQIMRGVAIRVKDSRPVVNAKRFFQRRRALSGYPLVEFE